jgi:hypothetical protein
LAQQAVPTGVVDGKIHVKLTESAKAQVAGEEGALPQTVSQAQTGIQALDQLAQQFSVERMERVFRPAGKYEPRRVEAGLDRWYTVHYDAEQEAESVVRAYQSAEGQIQEVSLSYDRELVSTNGASAQGAADEEQNFIPDDPEYDSQWHYNNTESNVGTADADIDLPEAHDIESGDPGVVVQVADSGPDLDHPDLEPMLWTNEDEIPGNGIDDDNNGYVDDVHGYDFVNDDGTPEAAGADHGSHTSGTVAAKNGNGQFGAGVAGGNGSADSGARIMPNKIFSGGGGFAGDGAYSDAMAYAADNGAVISQNSWGGGGPSSVIEDALEYFRNNAGGPAEPINGGLVVFSAGNGNTSSPAYPAFYDEALAVGASNENDGRSGYSHYGDWVDIAAPGGGGPAVGGCGTASDDVQSTIDGGFGPLCGTSMAAPHVSGVAALIASAQSGMSPDQVEETLISTAEEISTDEPIGPRLNAYEALTSLEDDPTPPAMIEDLATTGVSGNSVGLEWTAPGDDGDEGTASSYSLRYSTDGPITDSTSFANATVVSGVPAPDTASTVQSDTVSGLPYNTEVHFAIRAYDNVGNAGDVSNSPSETTEPGPAISVDPGSFDVALEVEDSTEQTLTVTHEGAPGAAPLEWSASVGAAPEDMTTPSEVAATSESVSSTGGAGVAAASSSFDGQPSDVGQTAMTYQLDDGSSENGLGFGGTGSTFDSMWLNAFQAVEGAGTVTQISTAFGCASSGCSAPVIPEGKEGIAVVYSDPDNDGNPDDAELLSQTSITVQDPGTDNFTTVDIAPTPVEGTFFVGVLLQNVDSNAYPMPMDESSTYQEASWAVATTNAGNFDLENLSNNETLSRMDNLGSGFPANWLLRAEGSSGFLAVSPTSGTIEQGNSQDLTATFDASGVAPGIYEASINVQSNDPSQPTTTVPSTLEVTAGPPGIAATPSELDFGDVFSGTTVTDTIVVENTGGTALEVTEATLTGDDDFSMVDSTDMGGYVIPYEGSREIEVQVAPSASGSLSGTLEVSTEQEVSASVPLQANGQPFVAIEPGEIEQELDLTTGDSTATQSFTITNQFDESLPFSVLIESLESEDINVHPQLVDENLRRWRQLQEASPTQAGSEAAEPSLQAAPGSGTDTPSPIARLMGTQPLDAVGVTAYGNEVLAPEILSMDLGLPGEATVVGSGYDSYAGNFAFANKEQIFWISNADNSLNAYTLEDGSNETIGTLDPVGSEVTWSDMETDPTTGTTYVTAGEGSTNRLYELDVDNAELELVGEYAAGNLVVAFAIDGEGEAYAHDISGDVIRSVNLETAESEVIGSTGINANYAQSMTWDGETGQMYMAALHNCTIFGCTSGTLRQVDRETGNTTAIGSFPDAGGDEFGWFATPGTGIPWLATNLEQGTLPAGATLTLDAEFDGTELVEGDYEAQITIASEDLPGEPTESVPVSLTVEAAPEIYLSKDALEFDSTFVGDTTMTQMVTVRNDGAADMTINSVSADDEAFIVHGDAPTDSSYTIEPGASRIYEVAFAPGSVSDYSATLSFEGEGVSGSVDLTGPGIAAPELAVNPESFEKQAYVGQTQEHAVEVSNTGGNPLDYNLSVIPSTPPAEDVLLAEETFDGSFPPEGWTRTGPNNGENWEQSDTDNAGGTAPEAEFYWSPSAVGTFRMISPQMDTEGLGQVVVGFDHYVSAFSPGAYTIRLETSGDGGETWTTVQEFPAEDIPATEEAIVVGNEDVGSDEFHVAWTFEGDSFDINWWDVDNVSVLARGNWLAADPMSGTIAPGESDSLALSVDTNVPGMEEGTYESGVHFVTNSPTEESWDLPFTLNVIESLTVWPETDSSEVYPTQTFTVPVKVESLDDLEVFSYETEIGFDAEYVQVQEVITDGTLSEGLTLTSSIEDGTVTIAAADGAEGPEGAGGPALFDIEGEGTLVSLQMQAMEAHGPGVVSVDSMMFNEGAPPATTAGSVIPVVPLYGDPDMNLSITSDDAGMVLDYAVGSISSLTDAEKTHADVSGDGSVTAFDASQILRYTVGSLGCFPADPDCEGGSTSLAMQEAGGESKSAATFAWGEVSQREGESAEGGKRLTLPLMLESADGSVQSIEVSTELDPEKVSVESVESQLPDGWQATHEVSDDGTLKIALAGATPVSRSGKVATVTLAQKEAGAEMEMGGTVAINEGSGQELETKSVVSIPDEFALEGTYPNPFSQTATLEMQLPQKASVTVEVYDVLGRQVKTAYDGELQAGASRSVRINGSNLSTGTYFYRVTVEMGEDSRTESGRMTVVR